jgi:hypothetical protein
VQHREVAHQHEGRDPVSGDDVAHWASSSGSSASATRARPISTSQRKSTA